MDSYGARLLYKVTELEVTGRTTFICESEFNELKSHIKCDNSHYSIRKTSRPYVCESYIVPVREMKNP